MLTWFNAMSAIACVGRFLGGEVYFHCVYAVIANHLAPKEFTLQAYLADTAHLGAVPRL